MVHSSYVSKQDRIDQHNARIHARNASDRDRAFQSARSEDPKGWARTIAGGRGAGRTRAMLQAAIEWRELNMTRMCLVVVGPNARRVTLDRLREMAPSQVTDGIEVVELSTNRMADAMRGRSHVFVDHWALHLMASATFGNVWTGVA